MNISDSAKKTFEEAKNLAEIFNLLNKDQVTAIDILHQEAKKENLTKEILNELKEEKEKILKRLDTHEDGPFFARKSVEESHYLKDDKQFILEIFEKPERIWLLEVLSERLRDDDEIVLEAIKKSYENFEFASKRLKSDKRFLLLAVKEDARSIKFASRKIKEELEMLTLTMNKRIALSHKMF